MTEEEELIQLRQQNRLLQEQVKQLTEEVKRLQEQVAKNSQNSSLPPSSDRFSRQSKSRSLRQKSGKKPSGQPRHQGHSLQMSEEAMQTIALSTVTHCQHCQANLMEVAVKTIERRQVIDWSEPE